MAIRSVIKFVGTGRPVSPVKNVFVNREPSKRGIISSDVRSFGDFKNIVKSRNQTDLKTLGRKAVSLQKSMGVSINVTI